MTVGHAPRQYPPADGVKTAIVTGGSSGIGRATAIALAQTGWNVVISGRRSDQLEQSRKAMEEAAAHHSKPARFLICTGNMTREEDVNQLFGRTKEHFGQVDLVFINAGRSAPASPIQQVQLQEWQDVVDINLTGAWLCAREAFRYMDGSQGATGGRIIMNGSISAHVPRPMSAAYTATKHGISGLSKSLSLDGRKHNIAVSQIDIGNAASHMTQHMDEGAGVVQADGHLRCEPVFDVTHAAREVVHIATLPLTVNVQDVVIVATNMPSYIGRG